MSKTIEQIKREHALLLESIEVSSTPFAVFDSQDRLVAWNQPYERIHSLAFSTLRDKVDRRQLHYVDLARVVAEQTAEPGQVDEVIRQWVADHQNPNGTGIDRYYPGVGWFRESKFKTRGGGIAGFAIDINENKRREARLEEEIARRIALEEELRVRAATDSLTGLPNRGAFLARAGIEFRKARRYGDDLSVIMMDADNFKQVNDTYGHNAGDAVLVALARTAEAALRSFDMVGRMGGEEFAIILVHTATRDAVACAERIRAGVEALAVETAAGPLRITASFGVAQCSADDDSFADILDRADRALYRAKRDGRNQVAVHILSDDQDDRQLLTGP